MPAEDDGAITHCPCGEPISSAKEAVVHGFSEHDVLGKRLPRRWF